MKNDVIKAFTLAEVLITLGIVGIIATVTIPALINAYQKQVFVSQFKKAYAETNQALKQMAVNRNCIDDLKCTGLFSTSADNQALGSEFVKYFKISKNCGISAERCWADKINENYDGSSDYTTAVDTDLDFYYRFITVSGISFAISNMGILGEDFNCNNNYSVTTTGYMSQTCGTILIDVNGTKPPNNFGRDIFGLYITNTRGGFVYPSGNNDDNYFHTGNKWWNLANRNYCSNINEEAKNGNFCAGRIMEKGWVMDY